MELISDLMGDLGKYQIWICFLILLNKFGAGFHLMAFVYLAPPVEFSCPGKAVCCDNPTYNKENFTRTIVMEFNLICDRAWLREFSNSLFQFGVIIGNFLCGVLSDKFGRKPILIVCVIVEVLTGMMTSFLPDYWSFTIVRTILGFAIGGILAVGYVLMMEYVGRKKRHIAAALFHVPFTIGHLLLSLAGYWIIKDYVYFQLGISLSTAILLCYICFLPESPRWLIAVNKTTDAIKLLEKIARINKKPVDVVRHRIDLYILAQRNQPPATKGSFSCLFTKPKLRKNILIMMLMWSVYSYSFYGLSQYIFYLTHNVNINVLVSCLVCLGATIVAIPLMMFVKRKIIIIVASLICSACLLVITFIPEGYGFVALGCIGVLFGFGLFVVGYLFCCEMFPTLVRNAALGLALAMARLGATTAPLILEIKPLCNWCVPIVFCCFPLVSALLCIFLPETKGCDLMTTIEEAETLGETPRRRSPDTTATR